MPKTSKKFLISDPKQLEVLASPVRQVIVDAITSTRQPSTIKEVAERINRAPDSLYYHFRALAKVGLILASGTKIEHGKPAVLYSPVAPMIKIKYDFGIRGFKKLILKIFTAATKLAMRDFEKGIEQDQVRFESKTRNFYMTRGEAWLTKQQIKDLNHHIEQMVEIISDKSYKESSERCSLFLALSPLESMDT